MLIGSSQPFLRQRHAVVALMPVCWIHLLSAINVELVPMSALFTPYRYTA